MRNSLLFSDRQSTATGTSQQQTAWIFTKRSLRKLCYMYGGYPEIPSPAPEHFVHATLETRQKRRRHKRCAADHRYFPAIHSQASHVLFLTLSLPFLVMPDKISTASTSILPTILPATNPVGCSCRCTADACPLHFVFGAGVCAVYKRECRARTRVWCTCDTHAFTAVGSNPKMRAHLGASAFLTLAPAATVLTYARTAAERAA